MKNGTEVKYYSGSKKFKKSETSYKGGKKHGNIIEKYTCTNGKPDQA